jgi:hypothetical protein
VAAVHRQNQVCQLEDTWPIDGLCIYNYQLATQVDRIDEFIHPTGKVSHIHLIGIRLTGLHRRASYRRASHRRVSHRRASLTSVHLLQACVTRGRAGFDFRKIFNLSRSAYHCVEWHAVAEDVGASSETIATYGP